MAVCLKISCTNSFHAFIYFTTCFDLPLLLIGKKCLVKPDIMLFDISLQCDHCHYSFSIVLVLLIEAMRNISVYILRTA